MTPQTHSTAETSGQSTAIQSSTGKDSTENQLSLLMVDDGYALLFADHTPSDLDLVGFDILGPTSGQRLADHVSATLTLGNLALLGNEVLPSVQGLVRLAPESLALLNQTGLSLLQSGGQSLGVIVNANGTIVAHARLLPAVAAQGTALGTALGPGLVLLTLQMQLASISRRIDENIELTREVLREIHKDQWATLIGLHETSLRALHEAKAAGTVTPHIHAPLATREADLRKQRELFKDFVHSHLTALGHDPKVARNYIHKNFDRIVADVHGMLLAEFAWYRSQVLRACLISREDQSLEENARLLSHVVEETKTVHEDAMQEITRLLDGVERHVRLLSVLPQSRSLPFTSKRRTLQEAVDMADALSSTVADLRNRFRHQRTTVSPEVAMFKAEVPDKLTEILTWSLPEDTELLALADANFEKLISNNIYLGITTDHFFVADQADLEKEGQIARLIPLDDIRYVRFTERPKKGPALDIITQDENLSFTFDAWAVDGDGLSSARRMANLFASVMNLPDDELRNDPLIRRRAEESSKLPELSV